MGQIFIRDKKYIFCSLQTKRIFMREDNLILFLPSKIIHSILFISMYIYNVAAL